MKVESLANSDVLLLEPRMFADERGFFFESFNERVFNEIVGRSVRFVQDNHTRSTRNVLRGLHYQIERTQAKLVRAVVGEIFDVAVDLRRGSSTFGKPLNATLSAENKRQLWIPEGYAHGYVVLSDYAEVIYKTTDYWAPEHERCIAWNDPTLAIPWPLKSAPTLSAKDQLGTAFREAETFA